MKNEQEMSSAEQQYRNVLNNGGSKDEAKESALSLLAGNVALEFNQTLGSRLAKAIQTACEKAWELGKAEKDE